MEEWVYEGKTLVQSEENHYFYRLSGPGEAVGMIAVAYNEDGDIEDVYFKDARGVILYIMHAVHFLSPPALVLNAIGLSGPTVTRRIRISNPDDNGYWEGLVSDVMYVEKKINVPEREKKTPELRF